MRRIINNLNASTFVYDIYIEILNSNVAKWFYRYVLIGIPSISQTFIKFLIYDTFCSQEEISRLD